jgi:hypothetical protein
LLLKPAITYSNKEATTILWIIFSSLVYSVRFFLKQVISITAATFQLLAVLLIGKGSAGSEIIILKPLL